MTVTTFDTLKFARRLKDAGIPEKQAEAEAQAIKEAFAEALESQVATKADMARLESVQKLHSWMLSFNLAFTMAILWKIFS